MFLIDYHLVNRLDCKALLGTELLYLVDCPIIYSDIDVKVAQYGELLALLNKHLGALALSISFLNHITDGFDLPVPCSHLICMLYYIIVNYLSKY